MRSDQETHLDSFLSLISPLFRVGLSVLCGVGIALGYGSGNSIWLGVGYVSGLWFLAMTIHFSLRKVSRDSE
jgi:hypothetical protein